MFNDLAKAIAHFENMIQENEINISCGHSSPVNKEELTEKNHHYAVAISAMKLILSDPKTALRLHKAMDLPAVRDNSINNKNENPQIVVCVEEFNLMLPCEETANE